MGRNVTKWVEVDLHLAADEMARIFWAMDAEEQSGFFNTLAAIAEHMLCFQLQAITDSVHLEDEGRMVMSQIGEYAYSGQVSK